MSSVLNLSASDIEVSPYPHAASDQIIDPEIFAKLLAEFPPEEMFLDNQRQPYGAGRAARINLMRHDKNFKKLQNESKIWGEFIDRLNSIDFVDEIVQIFANHIASHGGSFNSQNWKFSPVEPRPPESLGERVLHKFGIQRILDRICSAIDKNSLCVSIDIAWAREGYSTEIHTDNRNKLAAFLIYFNETDGNGGEFLVHEVSKSDAPFANTRYPNEKDVHVVKILAPKPNRGAIFLNCNWAYHGVRPLTDNKKYRQFLYVSIGSRYSTPIWHDV